MKIEAMQHQKLHFAPLLRVAGFWGVEFPAQSNHGLRALWASAWLQRFRLFERLSASEADVRKKIGPGFLSFREPAVVREFSHRPPLY
jgi:hypothetical protein